MTIYKLAEEYICLDALQTLDRKGQLINTKVFSVEARFAFQPDPVDLVLFFLRNNDPATDKERGRMERKTIREGKKALAKLVKAWERCHPPELVNWDPTACDVDN